jgi:2-polyprenyl-3-methyl-5-hydroxy-6-metoxy-1,4-benzoquinol methylase
MTESLRSPASEHQLRFSEGHRHTMYDAKTRATKAEKVLSILEAELGPLSSLRHLDVGCSTGFMTALYAKRFFHSTGIDIDQPAVDFAKKTQTETNIDFILGDASLTNFPDNSFDVVTCTHIYEHVPDARRLMTEIHRLLKPGGVCFFSAGNRFIFMEGHYHLPLLSVIPKRLAHAYLALTGKGTFYYENHLSFWGLKTLVNDFDLIDYTLRVIAEPEKFSATELVTPGSMKQKIALKLFRTAYWLCPTYLWILKNRK